MANFTEKELIEALRELLKEYPLDKITIKKITDKCGVSRNTFYYHFQDIYELTMKLFVNATDALVKRYEKEKNWEGGFLEGLNMLYDNKKMIYNAYKSINRESMRIFMHSVLNIHAEIIIKKEIDWKLYSTRTLEVAVEFYTNAISGAVLNWIESGMKESPKELAALYNSVFEGTIEATFGSIEKVI